MKCQKITKKFTGAQDDVFTLLVLSDHWSKTQRILTHTVICSLPFPHRTPQHCWAMCRPPTILWIPWIGHTACSWPCCQLEKWTNCWTHTKRRQQPHTNTLKTHNLSHTATKLVSCREHSVSGKGVIFTAVSTVQSQPTWQSVSLLIGLILGGLLHDFIVRIIIYVTDVTVRCATSYTKAFSLLYMLP